MAGATVGLADTFIAALDNPAGLAMTLNGMDANFTENIVYDGAIQNYDRAFHNFNFGFGASAYPWGFSLGFISPYAEGQGYQLPNQRDPLYLGLTTRELRASAARLFLDDRLSIGAGLTLGTSIIEATTDSGVISSSVYQNSALGGNLGAMWQFPHRFLLGVSYTFPLTYGADPKTGTSPNLPNLFQQVQVPYRIGIGVGWIPNRLFRADLSTFIIGATENTFLLRSDSVSVGQGVTIQPRLGLAYNFCDLKELRSTLFLGTYYDTSRIQDASSRWHGTVGLEVKPWILNLGWGLDTSESYKNYLVTVGLDILVLMTKLDLIPKQWAPPHAGFFPKPTLPSDEGLPRPLNKHWKPHPEDMDPLSMGLAVPSKLEQKIKDLPENFQQAVKSSGETIGQGLKSLGSDISNLFKKKPDEKRGKESQKQKKKQKKPQKKPEKKKDPHHDE